MSDKIQQWISVKERLPEKGVDVLTVSKNEHESYYMVDSFVDGDWFLQGVGKITQVTHWMPLPEPPEGE